LAKELYISSRSVNEGLNRAALARLYDPLERRVWTSALTEAVVKGIRFYMPATAGAPQKGMPTAWAAKPLSDKISSSESDRPVWPHSGGGGFGPAVTPLHGSVPMASKADPDLYELLTLVDAIRLGKARERALACAEFEERLSR